MKRAYTLEYLIKERGIVDVNDKGDPLFTEELYAKTGDLIKQKLQSGRIKLTKDNVSNASEDLENPYGSFAGENDTKEVIKKGELVMVDTGRWKHIGTVVSVIDLGDRVEYIIHAPGIRTSVTREYIRKLTTKEELDYLTKKHQENYIINRTKEEIELLERISVLSRRLLEE